MRRKPACAASSAISSLGSRCSCAAPQFPDARLLPAWRRLTISVLVAALLVGGAMLMLDARGMAFAASLPLWVVNTFNEMTDFGKSQWFLIPIGIVVVLAAVLATPAAGRVANLVLTSLIVRLSYVFVAIALPGLFVTIVKRLIGRVRPSDLGPFAYVPFSWRPAFASMPSGHATTAAAAAVAIGVGLAKGARADGDLRGADYSRAASSSRRISSAT